MFVVRNQGLTSGGSGLLRGFESWLLNIMLSVIRTLHFVIRALLYGAVVYNS